MTRSWRFDGGPGRSNLWLSGDGWAVDPDVFAEERAIILRERFGTTTDAATEGQLTSVEQGLWTVTDDAIDRGEPMDGVYRLAGVQGRKGRYS